MKHCAHLLWYRADLILECEMFQIKTVVKTKTYNLCPNFLFRRSCRLCDNVEKRCAATQDTDVNFWMWHPAVLYELILYMYSYYITTQYFRRNK